MKKSLILLLSLVTLFSCKKQTSDDNTQYIEGFTRVLSVNGVDTASTKFMQGRTETSGLIVVEDIDLKAELIGYTNLGGGLGQYIIQMTNKQSCDVMLRWHWQGLTLDTGDPSNDALAGNEVKVFTFTGDATPGQIKVQADGTGSCNNSSNLVLNITEAILPVAKFLSCSSKREGDKMTVNFSIDSPVDSDTFIIMWSPDGVIANEVCKGIYIADKVSKNYTFTFPAVKKLSK